MGSSRPPARTGTRTAQPPEDLSSWNWTLTAPGAAALPLRCTPFPSVSPRGPWEKDDPPSKGNLSGCLHLAGRWESDPSYICTLVAATTHHRLGRSASVLYALNYSVQPPERVLEAGSDLGDNPAQRLGPREGGGLPKITQRQSRTGAGLTASPPTLPSTRAGCQSRLPPRPSPGPVCVGAPSRPPEMWKSPAPACHRLPVQGGDMSAVITVSLCYN